jgi:hypothetical protein
MRRRKDKVDNNQAKIVSDLGKLPGITIETGHDDILVGYNGRTFWFEIKNPDRCLSKKTGKLLDSCLEDDQKRIRETFTGQYDIVFSVGEILVVIGY